jgi:hypothetical protein
VLWRYKFPECENERPLGRKPPEAHRMHDGDPEVAGGGKQKIMSQSALFRDRDMRGNVVGPKDVHSTSGSRRGLVPVKTKVVSSGMLLLKRQNSPISSIFRAFCLGVKDITHLQIASAGSSSTRFHAAKRC